MMEGLLTFAEEAFQPSGSRATFIDQRMHLELASSLEHLSDALQALDTQFSGDLRTFAKDFRGEIKARSIVFRLYYQLVADILEQDFEAAKAKLGKMRAAAPRQRDCQTTYFGHPSADQVCIDLILDGMRIAPVSSDIAHAFESLLNEGLELMRETLPELHNEISEIVHEIILVREPYGDRIEFHGASHYQFWGLLLLNPKHHRSPLEIVEVLAHEASHSLLFGLTINEPLVRNPDTDLFPSPLREDMRPMDGIYHATYVSARMCWAMETIAASGKLSKADADKAMHAARIDRENYLEGLSVLLDHADLSASGERILSCAREWMSQ